MIKQAIKKSAMAQSKRSPGNDGDRRIKQADRFSRLLKILELIQGKGRWNAADLAKQFECSRRTIHRHLDVLELAGVPWFYDKIQKCYRVRTGFLFPAIHLNADELLGLGMASAISSAKGLDAVGGSGPTLAKVMMQSSEEQAKLLSEAQKLVRVLSINLADHGHHQETIRTAQWALLKRRKVSGWYKSPYEASPIRLTIDPYRLCLMKQAWYLIGKAKGDEAPKTYRIMRFQSLRMLDEPAEVPNDFDLEDFFGNAWGVYRGDKSYDVKIRFTKDAAPLVTETVWHRTQQVQSQKDGSAILTFRVDGLSEIVHWVLGWTGRAEVLEPVELRELVAGYLRKGLEMNGVDGEIS